MIYYSIVNTYLMNRHSFIKILFRLYKGYLELSVIIKFQIIAGFF